MKKALLALLMLVLIFSCKEVEDEDKPVDQTDDTVTVVEPQQEEEQQVEEIAPKVEIDERLQFEITEETDEETLEKYMQNLFNSIEEQIAKKDYEAWYGIVSTESKNKLSDTEYLRETSLRSAYLADKRAILKNAKDYFNFVVVGVREEYGVKLKYVSFDVVNNQKVIVKSTDGEGTYNYVFIFETLPKRIRKNLISKEIMNKLEEKHQEVLLNAYLLDGDEVFYILKSDVTEEEKEELERIFKALGYSSWKLDYRF